ncbi:PP2C family protein-serine/threonine phosphatase [Streptomyces sp. NPDC005708]|uniref:PP2C family protein-serine/threonine phosphatase n=1 Tax=Streptomyces sp. NPDC005708 TaxID=3154564 RepID=UPI0033CB23D5
MPPAPAANVDPTAIKIARLLPAFLILGGMAADLFAPEPYMGLPLLAAAPLVGCVVMRIRTCIGVAAAACLAGVAVDLWIGRPLPATLVDLGVVGLIGLIGLWVGHLLSRQRGRLTVARDIAEAAQRAVLPSPPDRVGSFSVAARYEPAQTEARIGGDLYAVQETPFGLRAIVGDVVGKGLRAVPAVSAVLGAFREAAESAPDLGVLAQRLDHALERDCHADEQSAEYYTTALLAEIPASGDTVTVLSMGHPAPYLLHPGKVTQLEPTTPDPPLGTGLPEAAQDSTPDIFPLPPDATVLMLTDGVLEARNRHGTFYDPTATLTRRTGTHPKDIVDALVRSVSQWTDGERQDDLAVLALARTPASRQEADLAARGQWTPTLLPLRAPNASPAPSPTYRNKQGF